MDPRIKNLKSTTFFGKGFTRRQIAQVQETVATFPALSCKELAQTIPRRRNRAALLHPQAARRSRPLPHVLLPGTARRRAAALSRSAVGRRHAARGSTEPPTVDSEGRQLWKVEGSDLSYGEWKDKRLAAVRGESG